MAEETLVKEVLTEQMVAAGADLTRKLDRSDWPVVGALWLYEPENNEWRLLIVSPLVSSDGPLSAYRHISAVLDSVTPRLALENISVVPPSDPRVRALASVYHTGREIEGRRVFRSAVSGHYIDDAYLYRLLPVVPAA